MSASLAERHGVITEAGTIVFERILPGPIERVWEYLTDSEKRGRWLGSGPMEPFVGGKVELVFRNGELSPVKEPTPERYKAMGDCPTVHGEVTQWRKPHCLSFLWGDGGSEVTFELKSKGDDVMLTLTHRRLANRDMALNVAGGWHTHLDILAEVLGGKPVKPFWSRFLEVYEDYQARIPD